MFFTQAILILFRISILYSSDYIPNNEWNSLLHNQNNINEVVSSEWYLSQERTAATEYQALLTHLQGPEAQFYSCEFPARTKYIEKNLKISTKTDLSKCENLAAFKTTFNKRYISLVLSSEHLNSPASAFGHIMIVFHDSANVELDATVLHFSALTQNEPFFRYSTNGLLGIFSGYYFYEPFFKKLNEYSEIEQRSLYFNKLVLTDEQKEFLILHLFELKKARFKYYFASKNCGYQINYLLNTVYNKPQNSPLLYFLPRDVIDNQKKNLVNEYTIPPLARRAEIAVSQLNENERLNFSNTIEKGESPEESFSTPTKKALLLYNKYLFRHKRIITHQFSAISNLSTEDNDILYEETNSPLDFPAPRKIQLGVEHSNSYTNYLLSYRPALLDNSDFQIYKTTESTFNILKTQLLLQHYDISLKKLDVLDVKIASPVQSYFLSPSWFINSSFNRENHDENLALSHSFGIGQTFDLGINFSYYAGAGYDLENMENGHGYLYGMLSSYYYFNNKSKFVHESKFKFYKQRIYNFHDLMLIRNFKNLDVYGSYSFASDNKIGLGIFYHF